jgi:hypothetical protein
MSRQQGLSEAAVQLLDRDFVYSAGNLVLNLVAAGQVSGEELARHTDYIRTGTAYPFPAVPCAVRRNADL